MLTLMIKHCTTRSPWVDPAGFLPTLVSADGSKKNTHTCTLSKAVKEETDRETQWLGETGILDETKKGFWISGAQGFFQKANFLLLPS